MCHSFKFIFIIYNKIKGIILIIYTSANANDSEKKILLLAGFVFCLDFLQVREEVQESTLLVVTGS